MQLGDVAVITLNRPEALNALSFSILDELEVLISEVANTGVRALLLTGAGDKAFCAGADIKELISRSRMDQKRGAEKGQKVLAKLANLPMPTIALVNGYAFGGGMEIALACNFRLATSNAKFGLPEIKLGLVPGYGGTQRLPRLVGEGRALEIIMTGRTLNADEAEKIGLVNRIVEGNTMEAAQAFAAELTGYSLPVLELAREAVTRALDLPIQEGLKVEVDLSTLAFSLYDAEEGMAAFMEKRKAVFKDA